MEIKQYQIILVKIDPASTQENHNTLPCVVISPDEMNDNLKTVVVAPMTLTVNKIPTRIEILHDNKPRLIILDQIRTIDKLRVIRELGRLSRSEIKEVKAIMKEIFVD